MNNLIIVAILIIASVSVATIIYQYTDGFVTGLFDSTKIQKMEFTISEIGDSYRYHGSFLNSGGNSITIDSVYILYGDGLFIQNNPTEPNVGSNDSFNLGYAATFTQDNCYKVSNVEEKCPANPDAPQSGDEVGLVVNYSTSNGRNLEFFEKTKVQ